MLAHMMKPTCLDDKPSGPPMAGRGSRRRIEEFVVKFHISAQLGILFRGGRLAIDHEGYFRSHPAAAELLVFIKLNLRRRDPIFPCGPKHPNKIESLLVDPELWRMLISGFCSNHINRPSLPGVFT